MPRNSSRNLSRVTKVDEQRQYVDRFIEGLAWKRLVHLKRHAPKGFVFRPDWPGEKVSCELAAKRFMSSEPMTLLELAVYIEEGTFTLYPCTPKTADRSLDALYRCFGGYSSQRAEAFEPEEHGCVPVWIAFDQDKKGDVTGHRFWLKPKVGALKLDVLVLPPYRVADVIISKAIDTDAIDLERLVQNALLDDFMFENAVRSDTQTPPGIEPVTTASTCGGASDAKSSPINKSQGDMP